VWLARQLHRLLPGDAETTGLLALLVCQHARRGARQDAAGRLVPHDDQDRARWDGAAIAEVRGLLATTGAGPLGPYQVQAAIALLHTAGRVDWPRVAALYGVLARRAPSPVVEVNRAVAVGRADGPPAGLAVLGPVLADGRLDGYAPLHAAHADLLARAGESPAARAAWRRAAEATANPAQRAELLRRAAPPVDGTAPRHTTWARAARQHRRDRRSRDRVTPGGSAQEDGEEDRGGEQDGHRGGQGDAGGHGRAEGLAARDGALGHRPVAGDRVVGGHGGVIHGVAGHANAPEHRDRQDPGRPSRPRCAASWS